MDYLTFFGFQDAPFRITPDPQYFFPSKAHDEALQTLIYSIRAGEGFIQITGNPGTGKTLLLKTMLRELGDDVKTALILNPNLSPPELLREIVDDLNFTDPDFDIYTRAKGQLIRVFRKFLLEQTSRGVRVVIIIDEAQNLPLNTLEALRLLSNLETDKQKLLQIFLIGQRELEEKIESSDLCQLSQRITIRYCLTPFNPTETTTYINHRLKIASPSNPAVFSPEIIDLIYKFSRGTPRLINIICERILMAAYVNSTTVISKKHYDDALKSIRNEPVKLENDNRNQSINRNETGSRNTSRLIVTILLITVFAGGCAFFISQNPELKNNLFNFFTNLWFLN